MKTRQRNDGLRKRCDCARRTWPKCPHPWHLNFKWNGEIFRFSLERRVGRVVKAADGTWHRDRATLGAEIITDKTAAVTERDRLRSEIRAGRLQQAPGDARPQRATLTLGQLLETYRKHYVAVQRPGTLQNTEWQIGVIVRTALARADGTARAFGDWLVVDIATSTIEQFRRVRLPRGTTAANRDLALLRSMFRWAIKEDHVTETPFKKHGEVAVSLMKELKRRRRLQAGEGERLLAACTEHLRALVEAAIETGCRRGELLSLQWSQVRFERRAGATPSDPARLEPTQIMLPAQKTKTKEDRTVRVSSRLRAILEMRRNGPDGEPLGPDAFVFGTPTGEKVARCSRAWERAVLQAHGVKAQYVVKGEGPDAIPTKALTPECRAALRAIDLHFHDLRREAGSRWLEGGVPLHLIQKWLGHANISQTSTYLMANSADDEEAMRRFDARQSSVQPRATDSGTEGSTLPLIGTAPDSTEQLSSGKPH